VNPPHLATLLDPLPIGHDKIRRTDMRNILKSVILRRLENPLNEVRELILCETGGHYSVWLAVRLLKNGNGDQKQERIAIGWESEMRTFFDQTVNRLLDEGFVIPLSES
jgi:hypothetical protein